MDIKFNFEDGLIKIYIDDNIAIEAEPNGVITLDILKKDIKNGNLCKIAKAGHMVR